LNRLEVLGPYLVRDTAADYTNGEEDMEDGQIYMGLLQAFKEVKDAMFGEKLGADFEDVMDNFKMFLTMAHETCGLPISPKLHMISTHVIQWVRMTGEGLAKANEAALEAAHHVWWEIWSHYRVNDETSEAFVAAGLKTLVRVNADQS
jgi:hypothetical protein